MARKSPAEFVLDQISIDGRVVYACVSDIANSCDRPPQAVEDVLAKLERTGRPSYLVEASQPCAWAEAAAPRVFVIIIALYPAD